MAVEKTKLTQKLKSVPDAPKIIIVGFSEDCLNAAALLHELGRDIYAFASDDTVGVYNRNKQNTIFAEKYVADLSPVTIQACEFYTAIEIPHALFLVSTKHYQNLLEEMGFVENVHFYRLDK